MATHVVLMPDTPVEGEALLLLWFIIISKWVEQFVICSKQQHKPVGTRQAACGCREQLCRSQRQHAGTVHCV